MKTDEQIKDCPWDKSDWIPLCKKCHAKYDKDTWGQATKLWKIRTKQNAF
jgi:hypothetical protein